jgi:hypothetical protein
MGSWVAAGRGTERALDPVHALTTLARFSGVELAQMFEAGAGVAGAQSTSDLGLICYGATSTTRRPGAATRRPSQCSGRQVRFPPIGLGIHP